jgi:hypothetical protein
LLPLDSVPFLDMSRPTRLASIPAAPRRRALLMPLSSLTMVCSTPDCPTAVPSRHRIRPRLDWSLMTPRYRRPCCPWTHRIGWQVRLRGLLHHRAGQEAQGQIIQVFQQHQSPRQRIPPRPHGQQGGPSYGLVRQ